MTKKSFGYTNLMQTLQRTGCVAVAKAIDQYIWIAAAKCPHKTRDKERARLRAMCADAAVAASAGALLDVAAEDRAIVKIVADLVPRGALNTPTFSRVPDETVAKGKKMLTEGISASQVMRSLGVSYPTVLGWKKTMSGKVKAKTQHIALPETAKMLAKIPAPPAVVLPFAAPTSAPPPPVVELVEKKEDGARVEHPRRRMQDIDVNALLAGLSEALGDGCELTIAKDRGRFVARLSSPQGSALVQSEEAPLALYDALGKWHRQQASAEAAN